MTSLVNRYFQKGVPTEQALVQKLFTEAIQVMGRSMYYLPRTLGDLDLVFGEDILSAFKTALPIEMYIESFDGWVGQQEFIAKFGLEIRKQMIITVAKDRWETEVKKISSSMWKTQRPQEGDLIYEPTTKKLLEIKFVDHDDTFYQLDKYYRYKMTCELFQYNKEPITTGIAAIDNIAAVEALLPNESKDSTPAFTAPQTFTFNVNDPFNGA